MKCPEETSVQTQTIIIDEKNQDLRCRICYDNSRPLISVCDCSGSIGLVHDLCILDWIAKKIAVSENIQIPSCQVCHQKYAAKMQVGPKKISLNLFMNKVKNLAVQDTISSVAQIILFLFSAATLLCFLATMISIDFLSSDIDVILKQIFLKVVSQLYVLKACKDHFFLRKQLLEESMIRTIDIILQPKISIRK